MTPEPEAWICPECETGWNNEASAERCCADDGPADYSPSRGRVSYILSYD